MQSEPEPLYKFPNRLNTGTDWLEWTTRGADLLARPLNADIEIVWCWPGKYNAALQTDREKRALQVIQKEKAMRFWPMPNGEHLLLQQTFGFLNVLTSVSVLRFGINRQLFPADILTSSGGTTRQAINKLEKTDEFQLARALMPQSHDAWSWIDWIEGTRAEFEPLLRSAFELVGGVLHCSFHQPKQPINFQQCIRGVGAKREALAPFTQILASSFKAQTSPHVWRLHNFKCRRSTPTLFEGKGQQELSAHERLEALLLWRDFLRGKMPDAEIEALLRPLAG